MTIIVDNGCWERGCACYDDRDKEPGVEVMEKAEYKDGDIRMWWQGKWVEVKYKFDDGGVK